jgi:ABC-type transport system substrate-binding protein
MARSYWNQVSTSRVSRRRALATAGTASLAAAIFAACGGDSRSSGLKLDDSTTSRKPGTVWFSENDWKLADETSAAVPGGIYRSVRSTDQAGHYDAMVLPPSQVPFSAHVHEFLMGRNRGPGIDPRSAAAANPVPVLAEAIELGGDGLTATFTLRQGVKWHPIAPVNGRAMDMDDWRTSLERFLAASPQRLPLMELLAKAEYPDARHMVWKLNYPYAPLLDVIWSERFAPLIMPKELNANPKIAETTAIGTGYKILDKHQPSIAMEYRKHVDYWGGTPFIERWHQPNIPEYANRYAQFVTGNIMDFASTARDVLTLAKDAPQAVVVANGIPDGRAAKLRFGLTNSKTLPWSDQRVRIAIRRSINFKSIGEVRSDKQKFAASGIPVERLPSTHVPTDPRYWLNPEKGELGPLSANYLYDVAEAKKLMAAAGFPNPVDIQYWVLPEEGVTPEEEQLVIDSLAASGNFKVEVVRSVNTVAHRNCRSLGQCEGLVSSGTGDDYDADRVIYRDYHSAGNTGGMQSYPDPRIDKVADAQRREPDVQKRIGLIKEFQLLTAELMPLVPFVDQYTTFRFRWPWLRNSNWGYPTSADLPEGRPVWGGHKQWLDAGMPNRAKGAS